MKGTKIMMAYLVMIGFPARPPVIASIRRTSAHLNLLGTSENPKL
ncbi:MAG: hypothetical protein ACYS8Z_27325 [Planctomycetota bacterium]